MFKSCDISFFFSAAWGYSHAGRGQVRVALKMYYVSGGTSLFECVRLYKKWQCEWEIQSSNNGRVKGV